MISNRVTSRQLCEGLVRLKFDYDGGGIAKGGMATRLDATKIIEKPLPTELPEMPGHY